MSQDDMREELHRLVDQLPDAQLPVVLHRLADEEPLELVDASQTRSALESLYGSPIPEADLARARASLAEHRRAS
jgi:hypothetical protein